MKIKNTLKDSVLPKGFFRLQLTESQDGKEMVVGDTGWKENQITNLGFQNYIVGALGAIAGSKQVSYVALGTGGAPAVTDNTLGGEIMASTQRVSVSPSAVSSKTAQFTAAFLSANSFTTTTYNISNVGLFAATTTNDTLFAGNTYTSSLLNTNQNVPTERQVAVKLLSKLRKFGGYLAETIPSQVLAVARKGVEIRDEALARGESMIRAAWRHAELGRNALAIEYNLM